MSRYEWDLEKAARNVDIHGIAFEEAETTLEHALARIVPDAEHSGEYDRFAVMGYSALGRLLVVITSESGPKPRIISARRATKRERDAYQG